LVVLGLSGKPFLCQFVDHIRSTSTADPIDPKYFFTEKHKIFSCQGHLFEKQILILTRNLDVETGLIGAELWSRQIDYFRLNIDDIPSLVQLAYNLNQNSDLNIEFSIRGQKLDVARISAVVLRGFEPKLPKFSRNNLDRTFALEQWEDALQILQHNLRCEWISDPNSIKKASDRIGQLQLAKKLDFDIPSTLITNNSSAAREFYYSHNRNIILKALHHHGVEVGRKLYSIYTHRITEQELSRLDDLVYAPCILQQRLTKKSELRVTVVGDQVFAAQLDVRNNRGGYDDIHQLLSSSNFPITVYKDLANSISDRCIKLVRTLGLKTAAIDFVIDENNRLVFLEANPVYDWYWIERKTGLPITKSMADLIEKII
jgi:glutathione synthase/RimK-type ligase-like ATP-grasp enzyme